MEVAKRNRDWNLRLLSGLVLGMLALMLTATTVVTAATAVSTATFHDLKGELAGAPDIGQVTVMQDGDVLTVEADVDGLPQIGTKGMAIFALDLDRDPTTGRLSGAEFLLFVDIEDLSRSAMRWDGTEYVQAKKVRDPSWTTLGSNQIGFKFNLANFGWPKHVELSVYVARGEVADGLIDRAPDQGSWRFDVLPAMADLELWFAPTQPRAGAMFSVQWPTLTLSDRSSVTPTSFACTARLGGKRLLGIGRPDACRWKVPKAASGKQFTLDATAEYSGEVGSGTWSFRVA